MQNRTELFQLVGLSSIEMSILEDSLGRLSRSLQGPLSIKQCREFLPWKRGKSLIQDLQKLSQHCSELATLLQNTEEAEEAARVQQTKADAS
jgi:hypothetical protein